MRDVVIFKEYTLNKEYWSFRVVRRAATISETPPRQVEARINCVPLVIFTYEAARTMVNLSSVVPCSTTRLMVSRDISGR